MIRIYSPQLGISPTSTLGGEVHDYQLIKNICKFGLKVCVLLPKGKKYEKNSNLIIEPLFSPIIYPPYIFNLIALPYIFKQKNNFDILRIHSPYYLGLSALIFKKIFPRSKIVTTIHLKEEGRVYELILKRTINAYDHIFTVSNYLKEWIIKEYGFDSKKISVIYNGIDPYLKVCAKDSNLTRRLGVKNKLVLLNVGRLEDRKNVLFLVDLFERLYQKNSNLVLLLCGSGTQKKELINKIHSKGLEKSILILENRFGLEKNKLFNLADIFLFPSKNEGFGLVGAEAMACAKPVIASNNTSLSEVVSDGKTGYLAKTNDINDWSNKVFLLIGDQIKRKAFGQNGFKKQQQEFTWDKVAKKTLDIYTKLLKT